ncbi:hypothetical protein WJX73_009939 [Symbiochloris irregularis]|uniref:PPM-type phosphatase domain-containing protein n=1 Tax=Symbiochloris irregularis TaxID=706552 RepID=A0AAW1PDF5_9CHLO
MAARGPVAAHAVAKSIVKGEDFLFVEPRAAYPADLSGPKDMRTLVRRSLDSAQENELDHPPRDSLATSRSNSSFEVETYGLYCICDGHNGSGAARHACENMAQAVHERMPGPPPPESDVKRHLRWRERLQHTLVGALAYLHESFACDGEPAGCTATIVLQCGWYLTIANLGDSRAIVDTGKAVTQLTVDHRLATHMGERRRLEDSKILVAPIDLSGSGPASGHHAAGYGPLRMWPGGLCLSRALGDFDVGAGVLCVPHIRQVKMPSTGARVMVASDGVWDAFDSMTRVGHMSRGWTTQSCPGKVVQSIRRAYGGLRDDTTIIVVDFLPPTVNSFAQVADRKKKSGGGSNGGMSCFCLARPPAVGDDESSSPTLVLPPIGKIEELADMDVAALAGLMPDAQAPDAPGWYHDVVGDDLREIQTAAVEAWEQVRKSKATSGKVPSRDDLAGYFARAHKSATSVPHPVPALITKADQGHPMDYTVKVGRSSVEVAQQEAAERAGGSVSQPPASNRFRNSISSMGSYGKHFGHYARHDAAQQSMDGGHKDSDSASSLRESSSSDRSRRLSASTPPVAEDKDLEGRDSRPSSPTRASPAASTEAALGRSSGTRTPSQALAHEAFSPDDKPAPEEPSAGAPEHRVAGGVNYLMHKHGQQDK